MKKELIKLANHLDRIGRTNEADYVDRILKEADMQYNLESMIGQIGDIFRKPEAILARKNELNAEREDRNVQRELKAQRRDLANYICQQVKASVRTGLAVSSLEAIKAAVDSALQIHTESGDYQPERTGFMNLRSPE